MKYLRQFSLEKNLSMCYIERELLEGESIMNLLLKLFVKDREDGFLVSWESYVI